MTVTKNPSKCTRLESVSLDIFCIGRQVQALAWSSIDESVVPAPDWDFTHIWSISGFLSLGIVVDIRSQERKERQTSWWKWWCGIKGRDICEARVNEIGVLNLQMKKEMKNSFKNGEIMKNGLRGLFSENLIFRLFFELVSHLIFHEKWNEKWIEKWTKNGTVNYTIVLVGHHDVFHFRDRLSMNYEFAEDNGWVGICRNDWFQNWFKG